MGHHRLLTNNNDNKFALIYIYIEQVAVLSSKNQIMQRCITILSFQGAKRKQQQTSLSTQDEKRFSSWEYDWRAIVTGIRDAIYHNFQAWRVIYLLSMMLLILFRKEFYVVYMTTHKNNQECKKIYA